jgi:hypothetical protein
VSGTLTLTSTANGNASLGTYPLIPGGPGVDNSGGFTYDNLIYPLNNAGTSVNGGGTIDPSYFDFPGLLFGTLLAQEFNIYAPGTAASDYTLHEWTPSGGYVINTAGGGTFTLTLVPATPATVPELSSLALLSLGGLALAGWRRWKCKRMA